MSNRKSKTLHDAQVTAAAVNLRLRNLTYPEISETLGISQNRAERIVKQALDKYNDDAINKTEMLRAMVAMRYEKLLDHWSQPATEEHDYRAADIYMRTLKDIREFLALDIKRKDDKDDESEIGNDQSLIINVVGASPKTNDDSEDKPKVLEILSDGDSNSTTKD